jgi:hypothetical protein
MRLHILAHSGFSDCYVPLCRRPVKSIWLANTAVPCLWENTQHADAYIFSMTRRMHLPLLHCLFSGLLSASCTPKNRRFVHSVGLCRGAEALGRVLRILSVLPRVYVYDLLNSFSEVHADSLIVHIRAGVVWDACYTVNRGARYARAL